MTEPSTTGALRRAMLASTGMGSAEAVAAVRAELPALRGRELLAAADSVVSAVSGAGVLEPLLREPGVTDILVNGPSEVWVDRGSGLERTSVTFADREELRRLAARLAAAGGHRLDDARPCADIRLPGGVRVHALLPAVTAGEVHLSLRIPARRGFGLDDLVRLGALPAAGADILRRLVDLRLSFLVTGGTGTGKTTVLAALLAEVAAQQRIVIIEDFPELQPAHPHVVRLRARQPNAEGEGGIDVGDLVREALRMRPDRLVVGEARGGEITDLLTALNTGHTGGCGTLHVGRPDQLPARVVAMAGARGWSAETAHSQLGAAVDAVVHLRRDAAGRRTVAGIAALVAELTTARTVPAVRFNGDAVDEAAGAELLRRRGADLLP